MYGLYVMVLFFKDNQMLQSKLAYKQWLLKWNQRMAYQDVLDNCHDIGITETDLHKESTFEIKYQTSCTGWLGKTP